MKKNLFTTQAEIEAGIANFKNLLNHEGWKLFIQIVDANIEVVKDRLLHGSEEETKEDIDRQRDKLKIYEEVRDTPEKMIEKLTAGETHEPEVDPYDTVDDLVKARKNS